jgi:hypothetical protein
MFDIATRNKFRYDSARGELTTEQLWDMPLTSTNGFNLDAVARNIYNFIKAAGDAPSFVTVKKEDPIVVTAKQKLEVVTAIIEVKLSEKDAAEKRIHKNQERAKLLDLLDEKQNDELKNLSKEDILKKLEELDS